MHSKSKLIVFFIICGFLFLIGSSVLISQESKPLKKEDKKKAKKVKNNKPKVLHYEVTVTATRKKTDTFNVAKPVSVVNTKKIEEKAPNNVTDLLTELPGVDVNGVGANQSRPVIRGFRGQRILLLEDGIRMNNSRRQQDFGEIPSIVDVSSVEKVEVVRGPASVLYGSDAIGGVINIISKIPENFDNKNKIFGNLGYRYSDMDKQSKEFLTLGGNYKKLSFSFSGNLRKTDSYNAPAGTFGLITLDDETLVSDTGVKDYGFNFNLDYRFSSKSHLVFKYQYYNAEDAGFGFVEPDLYNPGDARVQIQYPEQKVDKYVLKYENNDLNFVLADHFSLTGYRTNNVRDLFMNIFIPFGIPGMPSAGIDLETTNHTDITTYGFRLEFNKAISNHIFTYGIDFYNDSSTNADTSFQQMVGFGPPRTLEDNDTPQLPYASYGSLGVFIQDEISLLSKLSVIFGLRYQSVSAKTKVTPGLDGETLYDSKDSTVVGAANILYSINDNLRLVFSVGRGFRSPNLIERFFHGMTPEGSGFQERNPELKAESSLNFDLGLKYRTRNFYFEGTYFNNLIKDGIRIREQDEEIIIGGQSIGLWKNENVDELRMSGVELMGKYYFDFGVSAMVNFTWMESDNVGNPEQPYSDSYSSKFNFGLRYDDPKKIFWIAYDLRMNGEQKNVDLGIKNPLGDIIPGFTVHNISAGITLFRNSSFPQQLGVIFGNITDTLYSEFSNASFFRPAPKRHIVLTWSTRF